MNRRYKASDKILSLALEYYQKNKRNLPWRKTSDPYHILVSEIMLQQTQVDRVVPKYKMFLKRFPKISDLAKSEKREVLSLWSGLGYNRRAIALHSAAKTIVARYGGSVPNDREDLLSLPGVGEYTASAVLAFAYNKEVVMVETNIRTVVMYHCFDDAHNTDDKSIRAVVQCLSRRARDECVSPNILYAALMDYGSHLKRSGVRINAKSKHYSKQSPFDGSVRQARGALVRLLIQSEKGESRESIDSAISGRSKEALHSLIADGTVEKKDMRYFLTE